MSIKRFNPGDRVLVIGDFSDPSTIVEYVVVQDKGLDVITASREGLQDNAVMYRDFVWPISVRDRLTQIVQFRAEKKKELDDSMKLVYELKNAIVRGEV